MLTHFIIGILIGWILAVASMVVSIEYVLGKYGIGGGD